MPKFQYTALSKQQKTLSGIIEADSKENAHSKLNSLKLSVVTLEQLPEGVTDSSHTFNKYKFEAIDKDGKKVIGTVAAENLINALEKLVSEYDLKVAKLASITATPFELDESANKIEELYEKLEQLDTTKKTDTTATEYEGEKKKEQFVELIDEVIATLRNVVAQFNAELRPEALEFLQKYEQHLIKIKHSDNTENVTDAALKVLKHLQETKLFLNEDKQIEEKLQMQMEVMQLENLLKTKTKSKKGLNTPLSALFGKHTTSKPAEVTHTNSLLLHFVEFKNYLKIIFSTKSKSLRALAFKNIFNSIKNIFNALGEKRDIKKDKKTAKKSVIETEMFTITAWLCAVYLIYYFISIFASEKILQQYEVPKNIFVYNTRFMIYFIVAIVLTHTAIKVKSLLDEHMIIHSKISYTLFSILFVMIIINL